MDSERKTLADLSSVTEKKYITLETGSELSGYTKDYLDRLCRLGKVECAEWTRVPGQFVVEINSLLRETHTLLISHEGINFVDRREISAPKQQTIPAMPNPVAPPLPNAAPVIKPQAAIAPPPPPPPITTSVPLAANLPKQEAVAPAPVKPASTPAPPVSIPVTRIPRKPQVVSDNSAPSVLAPQRYEDEWDELLFGSLANIPKESAAPSEPPVAPAPLPPSPYRPIATSLDPSKHHDSAPLFPEPQRAEASPLPPLPASPPAQIFSSQNTAQPIIAPPLAKPSNIPPLPQNFVRQAVPPPGIPQPERGAPAERPASPAPQVSVAPLQSQNNSIVTAQPPQVAAPEKMVSNGPEIRARVIRFTPPTPRPAPPPSVATPPSVQGTAMGERNVTSDNQFGKFPPQ